MSTEDAAEIAKFEKIADEWWDPDGKFKPLHQINPLRVDYIRTRLTGSEDADLEGLQLLDIGCGGGILSEALDQYGAQVTAIDRSDHIINVAKARQRESGSRVDYRMQSARDLGKSAAGGFDAVLAMEVLEHVPDVPAFIRECAALIKPGGHLFFATINRTPQAWLMAIAGAEYILGWLPRGTHKYEKLIRPSELSRDLRAAGIQVRDLRGLSYNPLQDEWRLSNNPSVNYLGYGVRG